MHNSQTIITKYKINIPNVLLVVVISFLLLAKINDVISNDISTSTIQLLRLIVFLAVCIYIVVTLLKRMVLTIKGNELIVQKTIFKVPFYSKHFKINAIKDFRVLKKQDSNSYWNIGLILYDTHSKLIMFNYENRKYTFGKNLQNFDSTIIEKSILK